MTFLSRSNESGRKFHFATENFKCRPLINKLKNRAKMGPILKTFIKQKLKFYKKVTLKINY